MILNLRQIQILDFLLQRLNKYHSYTNNELHLVIKINNSLWKGNLINFNSYNISEYYIDFDNCIEYKEIGIKDLVTLPSDFNGNRYSNVKIDSLYLLLIELTNIVKNIDTSTINLNPFLYNAVNLETNVSLPFLYLDNNDEFEVVSIVVSSKDECTHS